MDTIAAYLLFGLFMLGATPIVLSSICRAIAGKHAIDVYPEPTQEEIEAAAKREAAYRRQRYLNEITDDLR